MPTYFDLLPPEVVEKIYKEKHKLETKSVCQSIRAFSENICCMKCFNLIPPDLRFGLRYIFRYPKYYD